MTDPHDASPARSGAAADHDGQGSHADHDAHRRAGGGLDPLFGVRAADIEPYTGLRYLSKLFRLIALMLVLLLVAEVVTGIAQQGSEAIPTLVAEASRLIVFAALLWGVGDLVLLLIDTGHDVRAARVLLGRQVAHLVRPPQTASGGPPQATTPPTSVSATPVAPQETR
jgi:hypothetical protein